MVPMSTLRNPRDFTQISPLEGFPLSLLSTAVGILCDGLHEQFLRSKQAKERLVDSGGDGGDLVYKRSTRVRGLLSYRKILEAKVALNFMKILLLFLSLIG